MRQSGFLTVIRKVALASALAGAGGSIALMLHAGRRQQSRLLMLLFGIWVLSPFIAALRADSVSDRWAIGTRAALYVLTVILTLGSLAIYGGVALEYVEVKVGFIFLVVPLASWLLIAIVVGTAALFSGRQARRGKSA